MPLDPAAPTLGAERSGSVPPPRARRGRHECGYGGPDVVRGTSAAVGFRHLAFTLLVGVVAAVAIAGSARADIVYDSGAATGNLPTRVAVAHDDGSGAQTIVSTVASTGAAQAPGVDGIIAPAVS